MNRTTLFPLLILLGFSCFFVGCDGEIPSAVEEEAQVDEDLIPQGPPPVAVVDTPIYNFGRMEVDQTLKHMFTISNTGEGPLVLKKDRSTCKCTLANFEKVTVEPGESFEVELEWTPKSIDSVFSQAAYIKTNDPKNPELQLTVQGEVDRTFNITPAGIWNLGALNDGKPTPFSGSISSRVLENFEITATEVDNPHVTVKSVPLTEEELKELDARSGFRIEGEIQPGSPIGEFSERISVTALANDKEEKTSLELKGHYAGPLQVIGPAGWKTSEMLMVLGRFPAKEGKSVELSMFLTGNEGDPVEIINQDANPEHLQISMEKDDNFQVENRERYKVTITVPPGGPVCVYDRNNPATVKVTTNNEAIKEMTFKAHMVAY